MWYPELTEDMVQVAVVLLHQASPYQEGEWVCDCEEPCGCLQIESIGFTVDETEIKANGKTYVFRNARLPKTD